MKNTSKDITLNFFWNKETYMQAGELAYNYKMFHTPKKYMGWFFIALLQFGVVGALLKGTLAILLFSTILLIYWYYIKKMIEKSILSRSFKKEKEANKKLHIQINDKSITINKKAILWDEIPLIIAEQRGYLLDHRDGFLFFPKKAFASEEDNTLFIKIAKKHHIHIDRVQDTINYNFLKK